MRLHCAKCTSEIAAVDVNIRQMAAKCRHCDNVFGFQSMVPDVGKKAKPIAKPSHFSVRQNDKMLDIEWRLSMDGTRSALVSFLCLFAGAVGSIVFSVLTIELVSLIGDLFALSEPLLFPLILILVALWPILILLLIVLAYMGLVMLCNVTTLQVDKTTIQVSQHPLPWPKIKPQHTADVTQLYVGLASYGYQQISYCVYAITQEFGHVPLVGVNSAEHAHYLEQQIEQFLGIADRPVSGAL